MGVSGAGKTAVGKRLAALEGWAFLDADDLHSRRSREKMAAGVPLTDEDRGPWLRAVRRVMEEWSASGTSGVVACSALKKDYRRLLREGLAQVRIVYLRGDEALLRRRLEARRGHFFDPALLDSQLQTLEPPAAALSVDVDADLETVVQRVREALARPIT